MNKPIMITTLVTVLVSFGAAHAEAPKAELEVKIGKLRNMRGKVGCLLFAKADGFPKEPNKAIAKERFEPTGNFVSCRFKDVAPGSYAISVLHDEDADGELDTNFVGIPTEGYGASNNKLPAMSAPDFEESRFAVAAGEQKVLEITLKY